MTNGYFEKLGLQKRIAGILLFLFSGHLSFSQTTYYSRATGNWDAAGSWSTVACGNATNTGTFPVAGDAVNICNTHTINMNTNSACASVTLQGSGILNFNTNSKTLTVSGNLAMSGTSAINGNGAGKTLTVGGTFSVASGSNSNIDGITMTVTGVSTIDGQVNFIDNTGSKTFNSTVNVGAGGTGKINFTANETFTLASGNLNMYAGSSISGTTGTMSITTGTFNVLAGGTSTIGGTSFTVAAGATTIDGTLQFAQSGSGNKSFRVVTVSATGVWDNTIGEDPRMNGNLTNNGSWLGPSGGTCEYHFGQTVGGSYTISGNPVVFSLMAIENGTTVTNLGTVILDGNVNPCLKNRNGAGIATFNNGNGVANAVLYLQNTGGASTVDVAADMTFNTSFANNTVYYSRGGAQNIRVPTDLCYYNLVCAVSGTKSLLGNTSIKNNLTIQDAAITDASTFTFNNGCGGTATLTMTGTAELQITKCAATVPEFTGAYSLSVNSKITLNGTCAQTLRGGISYGNLTFSGGNAASSVDMTGVLTINGDLTLTNADKIIANSAFVMDCSKTFTHNSSGNTTLSAGQNISIGNFLQNGTGDLIDNATTITVCGSSWSRTVATAKFIATGRVTFNPSSGSCAVTSGAGAQITQFKNVTINPSKTLVADVNGINVGVGGGADWTNNGAFTHNSGTITFVGSTTVQGSTVTTFNHIIINTGVTATAGADLNIQGDLTIAATGVFTPATFLVTATGGNAQTFLKTAAGTISFYNFTVNKTSGTTLTAQAGANATTVGVSNLFTMTLGTFDLQTNTVNGAGNFTATGGDLQLGKLATAQPEILGTYNITGGTVTLNGAGAQTLRTSTAGGSTYFNLVFASSGAKTITGLLTINGDATLNNSCTLTANSAFVQAASKTFTHSSSGNTTLTAATNVSVGSYVQNAGGNMNINGINFTVLGSSWNKSASVFTTSGRVIFNGSSVQSFTDNGTTFLNVTMNNASGVTLNNDMSISTDLTFSSGVITTGTNNVILTAAAATVTTPGTSKFVYGNLRKAIAAGVSSRTFEVGTGADYTPLDVSFTAGNTAGNLTCSSTAGDSPNIYGSTINSAKTVNRYWTMTNNSIGTLRYNAVFNFINPGDLDPGLDVTTDTVQRYNGAVWNGTTVGTRNPTNIQITGCTTPASGTYEDFQIGNDYNANSVWNRVTGAGNNWSNLATWIQDRRGGITTSTASTAVTGTGTLFTTELLVGDVLMSQTAPGTVIGTILSITNNTNLVLTANAATNNAAAAYGREKVPDVNDRVNIGNPNVAGAGVTVVVDVANATCNRLNFTTMALSNTLSHNAGSAITVQTSVFVNQPSSANTNAWNLNSGTATISGSVQIASGDNTANRIAKVYLTTGTLNIGTNLIYSVATAQAAAAVLDLTGGAGRVNLSGALSLISTGATLSTAGTENVFNYNRTTGAQTVVIGISSIVYRNLYLNNTSAGGAILSAAISAANVTGDVKTQSGVFDNGGFAIVGNAARAFTVDNGATFQMTDGNFPTVFGTFTFGATSITKYLQPVAKNITLQTYGHLYIEPAGNVYHSALNGTITVLGDLVVGNGVNTKGMDGNATNTLNVSGSILINANATLNATNINIAVTGNWTNNGTFTPGTKTVTFNGAGAQVIDGFAAAQTFYNVTVDKSAGTLTTSGTVTSLSTNNVTLSATNAATFTAPATLSLDATNGAAMTLGAGTLVAGATINVNSDWTNNGATFTPGTGTVNFLINASSINGTAASQTFYNFVSNKNNGQALTFGGSTATINVHDFTISNGDVTAPPTTSVTGDMVVNNTGDIYNAGTNTNVSGNITYSAGTMNWGANVTLNGSAPQILSGAGFSSFTNLIVNNSKSGNAVTFSTPITVNGVFTLTDGHVITTAANILTLETASSVVVNAPVTQDSSFIKGPVQWRKNTTGAQTAVFPVGASDRYHRMELNINHSTTNSTYYTASYTASSPKALGWSLPGTLERVSDRGYWDLSKAGAATVVSASVKLSYASWDVVTDAPNLRVAKAAASPWADMGGVGTAAPAGTITSTTNFTTFGDKISLANNISGTNPLPVQFLMFDASANGSVVDLSWTTALEMNSDYFLVQRSQDGVLFEDMTKVNASGNSSSVKNYSSTDHEPYEGVSYYRLQEFDNDGKFFFSMTVAVKFISNDHLAVYPNPAAKGQPFNVCIKANPYDEVLIVVRDLQGKEFYSKVVIVSNDKEVIAVAPDGKIASGVYLVVATSNDTIYEKKIVIR